ncbi:MAG: hypothetical protein PGN24_12755 [Microbacterium arborescens]
MLRTLRGRLVTVVSGLLLIALALFGVVSVVILRQNLMTQAVSTLYLSSDSAVNQTVLALDATGSLPAFDELSLVVPPDGFFLALEDDRADVAVSAFLTRDYTYRAMTGAEIDPVVAELDPSGLSVVDIAGMGSYLVTTVDVEEASGRTVSLVSGIGLADADAVIGTYALWVGGVGLAIAGFAAVFGWRWARHELAPLERVAEIAEDVTATPMSSGEIAPQRRAPRDERHRGSETDRVAAALNRLITHVELSMNSRHRAEESMRRFIAEASHELRNPLASIRGYADFYAQPDADHDETQGALRRIGAEAARMSGLVDDLLLLGAPGRRPGGGARRGRAQPCRGGDRLGCAFRLPGTHLADVVARRGRPRDRRRERYPPDAAEPRRERGASHPRGYEHHDRDRALRRRRRPRRGR